MRACYDVSLASNLRFALQAVAASSGSLKLFLLFILVFLYDIIRTLTEPGTHGGPRSLRATQLNRFLQLIMFAMTLRPQQISGFLKFPALQ